ncbi:MAG: hypothetical protein JKY30_12960 [Flavobacteriales bacterium]|nr:hypothetical protein [Flavobacteriales bacterium]
MGDNLQPYHIIPPVIKSGTVYSFTTGSGVNYEVRFGRKQNNILNATIVFGVTKKSTMVKNIVLQIKERFTK